MKKITLLMLILCAFTYTNAQTVLLYKGDVLVNHYDATGVDKVIFQKDPYIADYKSQELNAGDKVEGKIIVEGDTLTKGIGGTVADYIDLGIKDDDGNPILWATHNLGANNKEEIGAYLAWGENGTQEQNYINGIKKTGYTIKTYVFSADTFGISFKKYCGLSNKDKKATLESLDDAATINWGSKWRTPTPKELSALTDTTNFSWTKTEKGYLIRSKIKGYENNSIFLPGTAQMYDNRIVGDYDTGEYLSNYCGYNGNTMNELEFSNTNHLMVKSINSRSRGKCIRPVKEP